MASDTPYCTTAALRAVAALTLTFLAVAGPASAAINLDNSPPAGPSGGLTSTGGQVRAVDVTVSGNAVKGSPGRRQVQLPVSCWWRPAFGPYTDPAGMLAAYNDGSLAAQTWNAYSTAPWVMWSAAKAGVATSVVDATPEEFLAATKQHAGSVAWYMAVCRDGAVPDDYLKLIGSNPIGIRYKTFPTGHPPAPPVSPQDLAAYAQSLLDLPTPEADRNPKIPIAGGASLVGLPTWFWVTNPDAAGGTTGTRWVRAEAGTVQAQLDATSIGVDISSPAGKASCTPGQARTAYARGVPETSACTLVFTKASVGHPQGYTVTVTANWQLAWTGTGNTGGNLGIQPHTWTTQVPVAEIQTIVTSVG